MCECWLEVNVSVNSDQMIFEWLRLQLQIDTMCVCVSRLIEQNNAELWSIRTELFEASNGAARQSNDISRRSDKYPQALRSYLSPLIYVEQSEMFQIAVRIRFSSDWYEEKWRGREREFQTAFLLEYQGVLSSIIGVSHVEGEQRLAEHK